MGFKGTVLAYREDFRHGLTPGAPQFPKDDPLFLPPHASGVFMTFFLKADTLAKAVIPMIRGAGKAYGTPEPISLEQP